MPGVRLTIAYDGEAFAGWARQPGQRTVQGTLEAAIATMSGGPVDLRAASRTDSGVHALGQVAAFDSPRTIDPRGWMHGLNSELPDDVSIVDVLACADGYNPRFDTVAKTYRYVVLRDEPRDPLLRRSAWFLGQRQPGRGLDLERMREAAACLVGTHDCHALRAADDDRENTIRTIFRIDVIEGWAGDPRLLAIEVEGNAFMKNMVRILAGTLVEAGRGKLHPERLTALLSPAGRREDAGPTAPAHALTLVSVRLGRVRSGSPVRNP